MDFTEQKQQIISLMKRGDKRAIAKRAGVGSSTVFNALKKCCVADMTADERRVWATALELMSERQVELEKLGKQTAKLSEKIQ